MPGIATEKAPIVRFEYLEYGQDMEASEKAGKPIPRTIPFAFIQPDKFTCNEYPAEEWLARKRKEAIEGRYNPEWATRHEMQFEAWKKGEALPLEGSPVRTWPALNKEQINRLIALGYQTIEQLADVPDTTLSVVGLDGRYLRDLARKTLEYSVNGEAQAREIAELKQSNRDKDDTIKSMMERLSALEAAQSNRLSLPKK